MKSTGWNAAVRKLAAREGGCTRAEIEELTGAYLAPQMSQMFKKGWVARDKNVFPTRYYAGIDPPQRGRVKADDDLVATSDKQPGWLINNQPTLPQENFIAKIPEKRQFLETSPLPKFMHGF
jgi:hypothetical protein